MYNGEKLNAKAFVAEQVAAIKEQVGSDVVILGLSGGVDSTVTAVLVNKAIGNNLQCIFVDHGLLRKNEFEDVLEHYKVLGLNVKGVRAVIKTRFENAVHSFLLMTITQPTLYIKIR